MWYYFCTCHWMHLLKWLYPCITWSVKAINIWILDPKVNCFRVDNPAQNITNHLFIHHFIFRKNKTTTKMTHWDHQIILRPHKPITQWLYIEVMGIMTKKYTISAVAIYTHLQPIIHKFTTLHTKPWAIHTQELILKHRRVNTSYPRKICNQIPG